MSAKLFLFLLIPGLAAAETEPLRIVGSSIVNQVVSEAARVLRAEQQIEIDIVPGGSTGGLSALARGEADIAMSSRPLTGEDRARAPQLKLSGIQIGAQVLAIAVHADVWNGGIRQIDSASIRGIYEKRITNWKQRGGPDLAVKWFTWPEGTGALELLAQWIYSDNRQPPLGHFPVINTHEEARTAVEFQSGGIVAMSPLLVDEKSVFALATREPGGEPLPPSRENLRSGKYPLMRPLLLVVDDKPVRTTRVLIDFLLSARGAELVRKAGFLSAADLEPK
jgi:phosphate transport system substrate-binding protein